MLENVPALGVAGGHSESRWNTALYLRTLSYDMTK